MGTNTRAVVLVNCQQLRNLEERCEPGGGPVRNHCALCSRRAANTTNGVGINATRLYQGKAEGREWVMVFY